MQAAAEPWVEAPRRICSFVLAILDGPAWRSRPRVSQAGSGAAHRMENLAEQRDAPDGCSTLCASSDLRGRRSREVSTINHLRQHPSTYQNGVATRLYEQTAERGCALADRKLAQ